MSDPSHLMVQRMSNRFIKHKSECACETTCRDDWGRHLWPNHWFKLLTHLKFEWIIKTSMPWLEEVEHCDVNSWCQVHAGVRA